MTIGVGPAPAKFEGYKYINDNIYTDWTVVSRQNITELMILYRNDAVSETNDSWMGHYSLIKNYFAVEYRMEA